MLVKALPLWGCLLVAAAAPADGPPAFKITKTKDADEVKVSGQADAVTFDVRCPSGIGRAAIAPAEGAWPKKVVLRLHLAGLESLRVDNGAVTFEAAVASHGAHAAHLHLYESGQTKRLDEKSPFWTEVKVLDAQGKPAGKLPLDGGYFELALPAALLKDRPKSLQLQWIDFFRG